MIARARLVEDTTPGNSLEELAQAINAELRGMIDGARTTLRHAVNAGELLLKAKDQVEHGQWSEWLRENCDMSERSAQKYMRLARHRMAIEANPPPTADLGIEAALRLLTVQVPTDGDPVQDEAAEAEPRQASQAPDQITPDQAERHRQIADTATPDADDDEDDEAAAEVWFRGLYFRADKAVGDAKFEDWSRFDIDPGLFEKVRLAAEASRKLHEYLRRLQAPGRAASAEGRRAE